MTDALVKPKPFARFCLEVGDANNDHKSDVTAEIEVGPLHAHLGPVNVEFLDVLPFVLGLWHNAAGSFDRWVRFARAKLP